MSVPVHIVTGFLGAGKTTILNRLLKSGAFTNTAVIVNEFGDVGIDHLLVESGNPEDTMIELSDGCLCCTVRSDLVDTLSRIAMRIRDGAKLDRVVIETTGLADPVPVVQAIIAAPDIRTDFHIAGILTVVCSTSGLQSITGHREARSQIAMADTILLSKSDVTPLQIELTEAVVALNPRAELIDVQADGFALPLDDSGLSGVYRDDIALYAGTAGHDHDHDVNRHSASIEAFTLTHDRPIPEATVEMFVDLLRSSMADELLRIKGIIWEQDDPDHPLLVHGVRSAFAPFRRLESWNERAPETRLVVIAQNGNRRHITDLFAAFTGQAAVDTPDRQALTDNPLAIPGF